MGPILCHRNESHYNVKRQICFCANSCCFFCSRNLCIYVLCNFYKRCLRFNILNYIKFVCLITKKLIFTCHNTLSSDTLLHYYYIELWSYNKIPVKNVDCIRRTGGYIKIYGLPIVGIYIYKFILWV